MTRNGQSETLPRLRPRLHPRLHPHRIAHGASDSAAMRLGFGRSRQSCCGGSALLRMFGVPCSLLPLKDSPSNPKKLDFARLGSPIGVHEAAMSPPVCTPASAAFIPSVQVSGSGLRRDVFGSERASHATPPTDGRLSVPTVSGAVHRQFAEAASGDRTAHATEPSVRTQAETTRPEPCACPVLASHHVFAPPLGRHTTVDADAGPGMPTWRRHAMQ